MKIEVFNDGDRAWAAAVYVQDGYGGEPASAAVYIHEVTVVMPAAGIVQDAGRSVRVMGVGETFHRHRQDAVAWAAAQIRRSAANLYRQAEELAEPRVVTV
jgi:hypothetical protein